MRLTLFLLTLNWVHTFKSLVSIKRHESCFSLNQKSRLGSISESPTDYALPRLSEDINALLHWIHSEGGNSNAKVRTSAEGWTLHSEKSVVSGQVIVSIPKKLCIFADPDATGSTEMSLLSSTLKLMKSIDKKLWRVRLAVAMLSERVRPSSYYRSYLRNLPFEFWGMPMFFNSTVFGMVQDLTLMQKTRDRCRFLLEFTDNVLVPLHKTSLDPFLSQSADVNAFGWAFAAAASRALRNPSVICHSGHVMVPVIDIASHSFSPSCEVIDTGTEFELKALKNIPAGSELSIDYGPFSNDELFADYGFSVDNNQYDYVQFNCDATVINTARTVMGQTTTSPSQQQPSYPDSHSSPSLSRVLVVGRGASRLDEASLHGWQLLWLQVIGVMGFEADSTVKIGGPQLSQIDPKLWGFLRVLYSSTEEELLAHGYDPFLLQSPGSLILPDREAHVIRTLAGIAAVILRLYPSEESADMEALTSGEVEWDSELQASSASSGSVASEDIAADVYRIIRTSLGYASNVNAMAMPLSAAVRQMNSESRSNSPLSTPSDKSRVEESSAPSIEEIIRRQLGLYPQKIVPNSSSQSSAAPSASTPQEKSTVPVETTATASRTDNMVNQEEGSSKESAVAVSSGSDQNSLNLDGLASPGLSVNVREVLKYRLRKKRMLSGLIRTLHHMFQKLRPEDPEGFLPAAPVSSADGRRARIRELLNEVRTRSSSSTKDESDLLAAASKWSSKWSEKGASL